MSDEAQAAAALSLTPEPSPSAGDGRAQLQRWEEMYGTEHRQIRRWIARGKERGEPCPLDAPEKMLAWIDKHLGKVRSSLRDRVQAAAENATPKALESVNGVVESAAKVVVTVAAPAAASSFVAPLDLASVGGVEGESVEFFRRLFAGMKKQLEEAYQLGAEDRIRTLHSRLEKVGESLRKHEVAAEARAKRLGDYLEKAEIFNQVTEALNILRLMREHRKARVLAELSALDPSLLGQIGDVLDAIGKREEDVLANLAQIRSADDVHFRLAA